MALAEEQRRLMQDTLVLRMDVIRKMLIAFLARHGHRVQGGSMAVSKLEIAAGLGLDTSALPERPLHQILPFPEPLELAEDLGRTLTKLEALTREARELGVMIPFERLRLAFDLSEVELRLLMAMLAIQVDTDLHRLCRLAWSDFTIRQPTLGFLVELVAPSPEERELLELRLEPDAPLRRYQLIELEGDRSWVTETPKLHRRVVMPRRVEHFLQSGSLPRDSHTARRWHFEAGEVDEALWYPDGFPEEVVSAMRISNRVDGGFPRVLITGREGSGRRLLLRSLMAEIGRPLMVIELERILEDDPERPEQRVAAALRESLLMGALVLIRGAEALDLEDEHKQKRFVSRGLLELLGQHHQTLVFTAERAVNTLDWGVQGLIVLNMPALEERQQAIVWTRALQSEFKPEPLERLASTLSRQFSITPGRVARVLVGARASARARQGSRQMRTDDIIDAVRRGFRHDLGSLAQTMSTRLSWDDLILPENLKTILSEVLMTIRHADKVMNTWGFDSKFDRGRGIGCLFSGPPGTGKTMTALLLAQEFGRETYRVDLSRVVDKYVGETEKNLGKIFDEAERAQAILLFDEADSLFGSRTDVSSSKDRYANLEVNYLLQRLESYEGVSILTTNKEKAIDEAFKRRLRFHLAFPFPDERQRRRLWKSMFPDLSIVEDDVDWRALSNFELSGGSIKNAVLRAAFLAAADGDVIAMEHLFLAVERESQKMGQLVRQQLGSDGTGFWSSM